MGSFINHYSFLLAAGLLVLVTGLVLLSNKPKQKDWLTFGLITTGVILAWFILRPQQSPLMDEAKMVQERIGAGTPVLLEFQSPYCLACTSIKPLVDTLEAELDGQVHIIRLNIQQSAGRELAPVYQFEFTPTFIFFDAQGVELWREIGSLDPERVRDSLK